MALELRLALVVRPSPMRVAVVAGLERLSGLVGQAVVAQVAMPMPRQLLQRQPELPTPEVVVVVAEGPHLKWAQPGDPALSSSRPTNNEERMATKIYRLYGIDSAMHLLRPGAKWEISNTYFTRWEDPRPCPTWHEVQQTMEKIKAFEDSIDTIWLPEQIEQLTGKAEIQAQVDRIIEEQTA